MVPSILLVCMLSLVALIWGAFDCEKYDSFMGATFDLTDMRRSPGDPSYYVEDGDLPCTEQVEQNFTYIFNVCGAIGGRIPEKCKELAGLSSAGALQVNTHEDNDDSDDWCYVVGNYAKETTSIDLLNHDDPTAGLSLTYSGSLCSRGDQRKFIMEMPCADKLNPIPTHALEYSHCVYTITIPSVYGCPLECPIARRHLCGGNGHCAYDDDKSSARCFCNRGYTGSDCTRSIEETSNYSPALLGLIITLFIIVCCLAIGLLFMVRQISAYKDDLAHYEVLKGGEDDSTHGGVVV